MTTVKPKRRIRPRVLKADYDRLKDKYDTIRMIAIIGWVMFGFVTGLFLFL